ncbi:Fungal specific transcription factor domain containing protein [Metarhizium acridum CQMa 102]|uniref:Fungal specific transcription factor domain containing protein n=1 Tax=Metarhizium acridum (strain CQMa 102) TaxID=655827 RepID=E9E4I1_METAQ|nr:Fungal specific transcription factor domain containing protein [Metarhizium acridum CQMa 102]EFY89192.1 Fungal specific transcription factor domain containing protein [Metarhizium acridum CQMa 102]
MQSSASSQQVSRDCAGPANNPPAPADGFDDDPILSMNFIGSSDQACKECRRRKARCNRALPTCDLCVKYRRHCLYEKHSRTPLTRKSAFPDLNPVLARLERAEALLRQMRSLIPPQSRTWEKQGTAAGAYHVRDGDHPSFNFSDAVEAKSDPEPDGSPVKDVAEHTATASSVSPRQGRMEHRHVDPDHQRMLERPPLEDFEWNENDSARAYSLSPDTGGDGAVEDTPLSDGMASLSVNEQAMLDAFFRHYHVSYPVVHEPTFRAQYSEVIPRPNGQCWTALAYIVAAIGVWTSAPTSADTLDMALFAQARSILGFNFLEVGNLSLVQALILASNYQQKRDKPNSGYNYLGLSGRMAMGLGLHKEFQGWNIPPLNMEIRRRVWWCLCSFDIGASITFGRPDVWPHKGVEVAFPLNVNDKDLTAASQAYPRESRQMTPYTAVATQARFHIATHECYQKVISKPFPTAEELLRLDSSQIEPWKASIPPYFAEGTPVPGRYALPQAIMAWRLRNLRIIMYRPFVIRRALRRRADTDKASAIAYERCLADAESTIDMIEDFWNRHEHNRLAAWYGLYFLFQAALIPCICLRDDPSAAEASGWRRQISIALNVIAAMSSLNASSARCHQIISDLCSRHLDTTASANMETPSCATPHMSQQVLETRPPWPGGQPVGEGPETQINDVFSMMWPNIPPLEAADVVMADEVGWMEFLRSGSVDNWDDASG